ncbi:MAG: SDR family NAD(P)-dependent oxidoreductase [Bdellovibrionia bacterium]
MQPSLDHSPRLIKSRVAEEAWTDSQRCTTTHPGDPPMGFQELLLLALAEVTGYGRENLLGPLGLKEDLGVSSIQRRKVLARFLSHLEAQTSLHRWMQPSFSELASALEKAKTLNEFLETLEGFFPRLAQRRIERPQASFSLFSGLSSSSVLGGVCLPEPVPGKVYTAEEIFHLICLITQAHTGYDLNLLQRDADLEADLGIDTIKQAQIAGQLRKYFALQFESGLRIKDFPTLGHWVRFIEKGSLAPREEKKRAQKKRAIVCWSSLRGTWDTPLQSRGEIPLVEPYLGGVIPLTCALSPWTEHLTRQLAAVNFFHPTASSEIPTAEDDSALKPHPSSRLVFLCEPPATGLLHAQSILDTLFHELSRRLKEIQGQAQVAVILKTPPLGSPNFSAMTELAGATQGLLRTLRWEFPTSQFIWIEQRELRAEVEEQKALQPSSEAIPTLLKKLLTGGSVSEVRMITDGGAPTEFLTPTLHPSEIDFSLSASFEITSRSTVLISGGLGGLGHKIALALTQHAPDLRIILLGRTPASDPQVILKLESLLKAGAQVQYISCDLSQNECWNKTAERLDPESIDLVIHAAGILEDQRFEKKTFDSFLRVYQSKVQGLKHLGEWGGKKKAKLFCVFSSVAGTFGNPGQCDYAAANAASVSLLEDLGHRYPETRWLALSWGAWDEVGMAARSGVAELIRGTEAEPLNPAEGVQAFFEEVLYGREAGEVVIEKKKQDPIPLPLKGAESKTPENPALGLTIQRETQSIGPKQEAPSHPAFQDSYVLDSFCFLQKIHRFYPGSSLHACTSISVGELPWLEDHRFSQVLLLPATFALEMMVQAARAILPEHPYLGVRNFRIFQSLEIPDQHSVEVFIKAQASFGLQPHLRSVRVELFVQQKTQLTPLFEAQVDLGQAPECPGESPRLPEGMRSSSDWLRSTIYGAERLQIPLGPRFQVLRSIRPLNRTEAWAHAQLVHLPDAHLYHSEPWAYEAGFHLCSWLHSQTEGESLIPHSLGRLKVIAGAASERLGTGPFLLHARTPSPGLFHLLLYQSKTPFSDPSQISPHHLLLHTEISDLKMIPFRSLLT